MSKTGKGVLFLGHISFLVETSPHNLSDISRQVKLYRPGQAEASCPSQAERFCLLSRSGLDVLPRYDPVRLRRYVSVQIQTFCPGHGCAFCPGQVKVFCPSVLFQFLIETSCHNRSDNYNPVRRMFSGV